ncbi:MAG: type II toxin-antitoxin system YafQ family toxin [Prevotella sp.]|nr:type II toxin-antitoxin system YafQ family toxin [Prevotella sp.]
MECHISNQTDDYLLIWVEGDIIDLIRIGSHSELYG